ncbi:MAG: hypothetical protein NTY04_01135 [Candidatus Staskawiczbacteria bacterium]|nr:hypothetical protein [Candidatus Staskawiczbacteria bacterium]
MNQETKKCQNCKKDFVIETDDFTFYEKTKVPTPTWCKECRLWRRLSYSNERHLYQNVCGLCGQKIISMYPQETVFPVYCFDCYRGDNWDPLSYGKDYDFSKTFFEQFRELKNKVPRAERVVQGDLMGNNYCNRASYNKNSYLLVRANYNENSFYSYNLWDCKDSSDCLNAHRSELAYECIDTVDCYHIQYAQECRQCRDSIFIFDCRNCVDCVGCAGLRNKQYYILNQPHTKEEYKKELEKLNLDTRDGLEIFSDKFKELLKSAIRESAIFTNCVNSTGNWLIDCKNVENSYQSRKVEDGKNLLSIVEAKDCMDYSYWGRATELVYETTNCGYNCSRIRFANESWDSCHDLTYCDNCYGSGNLFGCVGIRKGEYCILNKQYTKGEYEEIVPKIISHMKDMPYKDKKGRVYAFGEYFPPEFSASAYNTSLGFEYFPLTQKETIAEGLQWEDKKDKEYKTTISWKDLPKKITDVKDDILKETILCQAYDKQGVEVIKGHNCAKAFKITKDELAFYKRMNIPLPQDCPNTRHFKRFIKRNPLKLWKRQCMCGSVNSPQVIKNTAEHFHGGKPCPNEFETSYASDRPEIVYCEQCYQQEVV